MKVTVIGLGAVGGLMAARLAQSGQEVSAVARGATLAAVRRHGLRIRSANLEFSAQINAQQDSHDIGPQDLVIVALKGPSLPSAVTALQPLLAPHTLVLPAMNGVPWWFLQTPAPSQKLNASEWQLPSVDPGGLIAAAIPFAQVLGAVVHLAASQPEPGLIVHAFGNRLIVGEPLGGTSDRAASVVAALQGAGFDTEHSADVRREIWFKLWGNMTTNPVSALTGATADHILDDELVWQFMLRAMAEAAHIGALIGCPIEQSGEERIAVTRQLGAFKTSMLQDSLAGRPLELDSLVGAVRDIGLRMGMPTPHIDTVLGLTRLMARTRGLYPAA